MGWIYLLLNDNLRIETTGLINNGTIEFYNTTRVGRIKDPNSPWRCMVQGLLQDG